MKNLKKVFAIALIATTANIISMSAALAHDEAGRGWNQANGTCKHSHHIKDINGNDVHTDNSPSRLAAFEMGKACTTHDGFAGTCKTTMRRTPRWNHTWAVCEKNSTSYKNLTQTWNTGRGSIRLQRPALGYSLRTEIPRSEILESPSRFSTFNFR